MYFFDFHRGACTILLVAYFGIEVAAIVKDGPPTHRLLRAATKRSELYRRSMRITKRFEAEISYIDNENGWNGGQAFASQVKVGSQKPVFNLEEHEHHLQDVKCSNGTMTLHFVDTSSARDARSAAHGAGGGLVITSHESCNEEGERAVYRVHDVSFANDREALELSMTKATWQDAFDEIEISFAHTTDDHLYRRHANFANIQQKRQNKVNIPDKTPDNVTAATFDLASELLNTTFTANSFLAGIGDLVPLPDLPIEIGCKSCTTRGQLVLTQGAFKIDASQIDLIPDIFQGGDDGKEITSVITGGFMELVATGVGARLEMFARPAASGAFEIALFPLPILGFTIPGIGKAGAMFEPRIALDFQVGGALEVNYGLDVTVPDGSRLRVELTNLAKSGVTGFPGSRLTPLPVSVNVTEAEMLLGVAFKPSIPIGFEFAKVLKAEVTVSMSMPQLDAKLSSDVATNCGNNSNTTAIDAPNANKTQNISKDLIKLGPIALVEANISVVVDVALNVSLPLLPPPFNAFKTAVNIFSTEIPLISSCASPEKAFRSDIGTIVAPASAIFNASASVRTSAVVAPLWNNSISTAYVTTPRNNAFTTYITTTKYATTTKYVTTTAYITQTVMAHETAMARTTVTDPYGTGR
ncbi:hypothetical protein EJ02DRAFT_395726 [Clathrospora elynae]|uniref:GPI anchored protein n=1 Tax=Clathrospora elynae TaxID=706981 RepID=A0A6A5T002_9PLEO|nr:hypothetical protein EJ02DRAFT_395726 [Clathrospora elynae]